MKKKYKKRGFTLIEIIGAIVILGIIAVIAFATYTSSLRDFRENYYVREKKNLEKSAQEFFEDNRNYRPTRILNAQEVTLSTLETKEYTGNVVDYNGDSCNNESYVIVVKEGTNDYSYHACLICNKDGFDNTKEDKYCDKTWLDPTKVEYGLGVIEKTYLYKNSTVDEVREELDLPISYVRRDDNGEIIATRRGTKEENETVLPINMENINVGVLGEYKVTYRYGNDEAERVVEVYENLAPTVVLEKENVVATALDGTTTTTRKTYTPGTWAQNIIVTLTAKQYIDENITTARFEWNLNGRWQEFCDTSPCTKKITQEMNQNVQFRVVDTKNHTGALSDEVRFKIDNTKPRCSLTIPTTIGSNGWYTQDVTITFGEKVDQKTSTDDALVSGVKYYNIIKQGDTFVRATTVDSKVHNQDTLGITYNGYVEDEAENFGICEITFKRDTTKPTCTVTKTNTGQTGGLTTTITCNDSGSGVKTCPQGDTGLKANKEYTVVDNVGNTGKCSVTVTAQGQSRTKSCTTGNSCQAAGCQTYNSCESSNCTCNTYKRGEACGAETYKSCRIAECGVDTYKSCATAGCGCQTYSRCEAAGCETRNSCVNSSCSCKTYKNNSSVCPCQAWSAYSSRTTCGGYNESQGSRGVGSMYVSCYQNNPSSGGCYTGWTCTVYERSCNSYRCAAAGCQERNSCVSDSCSCATYNRGSQCSCETYKTCADKACGVNTYQECANAKCGVATYKRCEAAGCEKYNSCQNSSCSCKTYKTDTSKCGCSAWGNFGNWTNSTSCSAGESSNHSTTTECRTVYN